MRPLATPRKKTLIAILAAVALLLVFTATVGSIPGACGTCHAMQPFAAALESSAHANVSCYECHAAPSTGGWAGMKWRELTRMYVPGLLGDEVDGPGTHIERSRCLTCHEDVLNSATQTDMRIIHASCAPAGACDTCHSSVAHRSVTRWATTSSMGECIACHRAERKPLECDTCHEDRSRAARPTTGSWAMTHGENWQQTHGMGDLRICDLCHAPAECAACHGIGLPHPVSYGGMHSEEAIAQPDSCTDCHDGAAFCDGCHRIEMPHPTGFLEAHITIATSDDDASCTACHRQGDCDTCHTLHARSRAAKDEASSKAGD